MKTIKNIAAIAVILMACLPLLLIFNDADSIWPNIAGLAYAGLLFRYGSALKPKFVEDFEKSLGLDEPAE